MNSFNASPASRLMAQTLAGATSKREDARQARAIPPMLYLPVHETAEGIRLAEVRELTDGRRALLAYTALDRLLDAGGEYQLWALVKLEALEDIRIEQPFDTVGFDIGVPSALRGNGMLK